MLHINDLQFRHCGRVIFDGATAAVARGRRVGLIGPNGAGKTTLLRLIAREIEPDGGQLGMPSRWRCATVAQEAPGGATSVIDTVLAADVERSRLMAAAETETDGHALGDIHTRLADIGAHAAPARAAAILAGLGFPEADQHRLCETFSGGLRMRIALAATLFLEPDLLLLDEPTNHLDLEASLWLEGYLRSYPHTMVVVSHDRGLLNRVTDTTLHIERGKLDIYSGGYDAFERARREKLQLQAALGAKQEAERRRIQVFVDRFRYKASKAKQAQSRLKALARMEPIVTAADRRSVRFDFPKPDPLSPPLITLDEVSVGYGEAPILRHLNLRIDAEDRIALLGANGNGKSTLVKLLSDRLKPMSGRLRKSAKLKVGYFAQHQTDELQLGNTVVEEAMAWQPRATETAVRSHLGAFGFTQERADTRVGALSGGEKARLLLALMSREAPHILMLDEPTNHLDIDSRQALVQALNAYEGAVILISHDLHLVELTADTLWLVADGACRPYDGDLDAYRRLLAEQRRSGVRQSGESPSGPRTESRRDQRRAAAEARASLAPLRKRTRDLEASIQRLEAERAALEQKLADPALYAGPAEAVTKLQVDLSRVRDSLTAAEDAWLAAQEALEAAS